MTLKSEFNYYLNNKGNLLEDYENTYIIIKNQAVIGAYSNQEDAQKEASFKYEPGSFLIQKVSKDDDDSVQEVFSMIYS